MPLPPLPANNTDRVWLRYTISGIGHDICWRVPSATAQATIITAASTLANALKGLLRTTEAFTGLKHQDSGSNLTFPLAWTPVVGTLAGAPTDIDNRAKFMAMSGRSLAGYRCRITFFTSEISDSIGYRENVPASNQLTFRNAVMALSPAPVAVDGAAVVWNSYVNLGYNAYWQRRVRL